MTNTEYLYNGMLKYQKARAAARDEYLRVMKLYEGAKGTPFYDEQRDKAQKIRNEAVSAAQGEARRVVDSAINYMNKAVSGRKMVAPTQEQLNLLTLLKMRDTLTRDELQAAANAMDGNGAALGLLSEMARKHNVLTNFNAMATDGLSPTAAADIIREITKGCAERINDPVGVNHASALAAKFNARATGKEYDTDDLPQETPYSGEADFYGRMVNIPYDVLSKSLND